MDKRSAARIKLLTSMCIWGSIGLFVRNIPLPSSLIANCRGIIGLLFLLLVCGIATCLSRNLLVSLVIFMAYSVIMSIVWVLLQAPDLAITEAAVGAGVSSVLLFLTLKKIRNIRKKVQDEEK